MDLLVTANDALHISCHWLPASLHIAVAREREQTEIASRNSRPVSMGFFSHSLLHLHYMKLQAIDRHAAGSVCACIFMHHDSFMCSSLVPLNIIGSCIVAVKTQRNSAPLSLFFPADSGRSRQQPLRSHLRAAAFVCYDAFHTFYSLPSFFLSGHVFFPFLPSLTVRA